MNEQVETAQTRCQACAHKITYRVDVDPFPVYCDPCKEARKDKVDELETFNEFSDNCGSKYLGHCMRLTKHSICSIKICPLRNKEKTNENST